MMNIPVLGIVENMSYFKCPDCGEKHSIFGESHIDDYAEKYSIDTVSKIPMDPKFAAACDRGMIELFEGNYLENLANKIETLE
jgi:Mrp family chromosome partitioning ATPase